MTKKLTKQRGKPVRLFPELYDISDFVNQDHPVFHPDSTQYLKYWEPHEICCIEGKWGLDADDVTNEGGYRYMPPNLYYYINLCRIADEDDSGNTVGWFPPRLRDVEWILAYAWFAARGFSGFADDPDHTCLRMVDKIERGEELDEKEVLRFEKFKPFVTKSDGTYKKYMEAREYLYRTHKDPMGKPLYHNAALNLFILGSRGFGKMTLPEEPIRIKDGWTTMEDVQIGDKVIGSDGKESTVVNKTELQVDLQMYKITLRDGREAIVCEDHQWKVWDKNKNRNKEVEYSTLSTKDMFDQYYWNRVDSKHKKKYGRVKYTKEFRYALPVNKAIDDTHEPTWLHPYIMGCILGDGHIGKKSVSISSADSELIEKFNFLLPEGWFLKPLKNGRDYVIKHNIHPREEFLSLLPKKLLGTRSETKFIPNEYLYNSIDFKWELLRGLLDTDGYSSRNSIEYCTVSPRLNQDVQDLVRSLGYNCTSKKSKAGYRDKNNKYVRCQDRYRISIYGDKEMFSLSRKQIYDIKTSRHDKTFITKIEKLNRDSGYCISVDNEDHTYIINNYIVTHNSFFAANAVIGHEYNFYGNKYYDEKYLNGGPSGVEIFVGAAISSKSSDLLNKFNKNQEYLKTKVGAWGKGDDFIPGYFFNNNSGSLTPNNSQRPYTHEYSYKDAGTWIDGGTGTKIYHGVYTSENPQAAVGTRPTVMVIEEVGLLNQLLSVHGANETCQIRKSKFGSSLYIGTGGNMEKITESKIVFEDPASYGFLPCVDVFENRTRPIGLFIPSYYVDSDFKDDKGNTKLDQAFDYEMRIREKKGKAANSSALDEYMMSRPIVPSEMFLTAGANIFPQAKIRERIAELEINDTFKLRASIGHLEWEDGSKKSTTWVEDVARRKKPIISLNLDSYKSDITGAIVVYEHPIENIPVPTFMRSLYKVVYDPVKDDMGGTSLASILVYKGFSDTMWDGGLQDTIVAEWIGRHDSVDDIHEICIKLALYYNAKILVETNIPDFVRYCKKNLYYNILQPSPHEAISRVIANPSKKYDVGVVMTNHRNAGLKIHAEQLARQWLLTEWKNTENGATLTNIDRIYSLRLLYELAAYNRDQNFDHVSAMLLLGLWLSQEKEIVFSKSDVSKVDKARELEAFMHRMVKKNTFKINEHV